MRSIGGWAGFVLEKAYLAGLAWSQGRPKVTASAPVISIGNLVVGGTGKTPCTLWIARRLHERGVEVAIVARPVGGAVPNAEGDEIALLRAGAPFARVHASTNKSEAALEAARSLRKPGVVLVDDGFSHARLARDLDVVLVDAARPIGNGHLLPRGSLREPPTALARAGVVIATRADRIDTETLDRTLGALAKLAPDAALAAAALVPAGLSEGTKAGRNVACLSGLARAGELAWSARALGLNVVHDLCYPDHHRFGASEWRDALAKAAPLDGGLVVSAKDATRLTEAQRKDVRVLAVEWRFLRGEAEVLRRITEVP